MSDTTNARAELRDMIAQVLLRDVAGLKREIEAYPDEETPWREVPGLTNSGGTLALHIAGNLQHYFGAVLGGSGYVRDRPREFAARGVSRAELIAGLDAGARAVADVMRTLDPARLAETYPEQVANASLRTDLFMLHLVAHLGYHLGQTDYHRRAVTGVATTVGTVSAPALVAP